MFRPHFFPIPILTVCVATWEAWCSLSEAAETSTNALRRGMQAERETEALRIYNERSIDQGSTFFGQIPDQGLTDQPSISLRPLQLFPENVTQRLFPEEAGELAKQIRGFGPTSCEASQAAIMESENLRLFSGAGISQSTLKPSMEILPGQNSRQLRESFPLTGKAPLVGRPFFQRSLPSTSSSPSGEKRKYSGSCQTDFALDARQGSSESPEENRQTLLHRNDFSEQGFGTHPHVQMSTDWDAARTKQDKPNLSVLLPRFWRQKVGQINTVKLDDGNSGFRAAALSMGRPESDWARIRFEIHKELTSNPVFLNQNLMKTLWNKPVEDIARDLMKFDRDDLDGHSDLPSSMEFPVHAFLLAETYKRPIVFLSSTVCYTVPPLSYPPNHNPPILLASLGLNNHFVTFAYKEGILPAIPEISPIWHRFCWNNARKWSLELAEIRRATKIQEDELKYTRKTEANQNDVIEVID